MTAVEQPPVEDAAGEQPEGSRIAGALVLAAVVGGPAAGLAVLAPEGAYFVAGVLATVGARRARTWAAGRRRDEEQAEGEQRPAVDIAEHLRALSRGGLENVLLTRLQQAADLPDTKAVRALLDTAGVRVRAGVRTPHGNGPGVHQDDVPPAPLPSSASCGEGCCCTSAANANANNGPEQGAREGLRVEPIGQAGTVIHDRAEAVRHHRVGR